ncbi:hypothetical protein, conserved [Eimeria praecox]|uniref:Uncharacterized protein n=1 Tax=Eimeria praecox TaxID=51316 RepID=U6G116_9EIME|nr:hypothetical protein, conserved [Eimeria praecox]
MAPRFSSLLAALGLLLLLSLQGPLKWGPSLVSAAAGGNNNGSNGKGGGSSSGGSKSGSGAGTGGSGTGNDKDGDASSGDESKNGSKKKKDGASPERPSTSKPPPPRQPPKEKGLAQALPLLWNAAANTSAASDEASDLEDYNAALGRIFERRMAFPPRYKGALEDINEAVSRDLLDSNTKMPASERQKILYSLGGRGTYLEVPQLLKDLREEADHPVEERLRIQSLHRFRRRGVPINVEELRKRPFTRREFVGPVTTVEYEAELTDADIHQRQSVVNGWLNMQNRARVLQKQHLRHRRPVGSTDPVHDDDFPVDEEDILGLSFGGKLSKEEGGEYGEEYRAYLEGDGGKGVESDEEANEQ